MDRSRNLGQVTLVLVALGALFGVQWLSSGIQTEESRFFASQLRSGDEVVAFRAHAELEDGARLVRANVIHSRPGEVVIEVSDFLFGTDRLLASSQWAEVREMDSFEPLVVALSNDQRFVVIEPEAEWGRVHRDTGLGVAMYLAD